MKNESLHRAKKLKEDEFYTQLADIESELRHYKNHFKNKVVLCNCDDPRVSNFFHYFSYNFEKLGLKKLISICYKSSQRDLFSNNTENNAVFLEYTGDKNNNKVPDLNEIGINKLKGDGDFRSKECIDLLKKSDIVVTNPPFSLFREYVSQLMEFEKKFLIIGNQNAITYKDIFPYLRENKMWLGYKNGDMSFRVPDHYKPRKTRYWEDDNGKKWRSFGNICWFTNLKIKKREEKLILYENYSEEKYPKYQNYDAIEVSNVKKIPINYNGFMGVPITFMSKHCPSQFKLIGMGEDNGVGFSGGLWKGGSKSCIYNGVAAYKRIFIKKFDEK